MDTLFPNVYGGRFMDHLGDQKKWLNICLMAFLIALTVAVIINAVVSFETYKCKCKEKEKEKKKKKDDFVQYLGASTDVLRTDNDTTPDSLMAIARMNQITETKRPVAVAPAAPAGTKQSYTEPELEVMRKQRAGTPA
jgi:hypothetical protein